MSVYISMEGQSLNPPVRPVCPEAPVWPVRPLAPASRYNASHCVTCLPFPVQSPDDLPCQYISQWKAPPVDPSEPCKTCKTKCLTLSHACPSQKLPGQYTSQWNARVNPPVRPVCPEAGLACKTAASSRNASHCVTCLPCLHTLVWIARVWSETRLLIAPMSHSVTCLSQCKALMICVDTLMDCQGLNPPVRPVCPEAPVWPVSPLAPTSRLPHMCHMPPLPSAVL